jgi:hypothetical protein
MLEASTVIYVMTELDNLSLGIVFLNFFLFTMQDGSKPTTKKDRNKIKK